TNRTSTVEQPTSSQVGNRPQRQRRPPVRQWKGLTSEEAIKLALELGAPFAKTALDRLHVDNPYVGSNSVRESYSPSLRLLATDGIGENNQVRWIIEDN
ncbi:hypothetical protein Bhyg_13659, partial [Pseudolycoriella hygida]